MSQQVSLVRLYLMRVLFLLNFALLGLDVWPALISHSSPWDPVRGAAQSLWAALSLLSILGLRHPLQMLPLLLFQFTYKAIWLLLVALPQWAAFKGLGITQAMAIGIVLDTVVIPWAYAYSTYIKKPGDRWRGA